jgi:hypothetical protein
MSFIQTNGINLFYSSLSSTTVLYAMEDLLQEPEVIGANENEQAENLQNAIIMLRQPHQLLEVQPSGLIEQ